MEKYIVSYELAGRIRGNYGGVAVEASSDEDVKAFVQREFSDTRTQISRCTANQRAFDVLALHYGIKDTLVL